MAFFEDTFDTLFDHGQIEHIVACHYIKTVTAAHAECRNAPDAS